MEEPREKLQCSILTKHLLHTTILLNNDYQSMTLVFSFYIVNDV